MTLRKFCNAIFTSSCAYDLMTTTMASRVSQRQSQDSERVLVIGDDTRATLAVVRSLGRAGKEVHIAPFNWHSPTTHSRYVARVHQLPRNTRMQSWVEAAAEILARWHFDLVIPCFFFLMIRRPPRSTRTDTSFPHELFR